MIFIINLSQIYIRKILRYLNKGYRYFNQKIDFNKIKPKIIKFELVHLSETDKKKVKEILNNENYQTFKLGVDTITIDLSKIKLYWK